MRPRILHHSASLVLEYLGREHCHRLLDNPNAIHGYWADLAAWLSLDWYPRVRRAGLENHAVVYSKDYLGRCSTEEVLFGIVSGSVAGFEDLASAQRALLNQQFSQPDSDF